MTRPLLAYFGHHKCASQWIAGILRSICKATARRHETIYGMDEANTELADYVAARGVECLIYANAIPYHVTKLADFRGVHVVRDPRDVIVSGYFSHLKTHTTGDWPELVPHRERLQQLPKAAGLLAEMEFSGYHLDRMRDWNYEQSNVLELRLEDMIGNEVETFTAIVRFLGLLEEGEAASAPRRWRNRAVEFINRVHSKTNGVTLLHRRSRISPVRLAQIVHAHRFARKAAGRQQGQEDKGSHYRRGTPGDWRNHFEAEHVELFKQRWAELLVRLGYEAGADW